MPVVGLAVVVALVVGFSVRIGTPLPNHAILLVNSLDDTYVTVPCIIKGAASSSYIVNTAEVIKGTEEVVYEPFVTVMTKLEARKLRYRPDQACASADGFVFTTPIIIHQLGGEKKRVLADGTVLW